MLAASQRLSSELTGLARRPRPSSLSSFPVRRAHSLPLAKQWWHLEVPPTSQLARRDGPVTSQRLTFVVETDDAKGVGVALGLFDEVPEAPATWDFAATSRSVSSEHPATSQRTHLMVAPLGFFLSSAALAAAAGAAGASWGGLAAS